MSTLAFASFARNPAENAVPSYVLYSPQGSKPLAGLQVEGGTASRYYDKETRSQLLRISPSARVSFLNNTSSRIGSSSTVLAAASQRIVVLQFFCEESARTTFSFTMELLLQDKMGRRRVLFGNNFHKVQRFAQHVKVPLLCVSSGMWSNIVLDVPHIHATLYGSSEGRMPVAELIESRRLLSVTISCSNVCRVRRVLGMSQLPSPEMDMTTAEWPLSLRLPPNVPMRFWIIRTCEEEFLQHAGVLNKSVHHHEEPNEGHRFDFFAPVLAQGGHTRRPVAASVIHSLSVVSEVTDGNPTDLEDVSEYNAGDRRGPHTNLTVARSGPATLYMKGHKTEERYTQREKRKGSHEVGTETTLSSRMVSGRNVGVQTSKLMTKESQATGRKNFSPRESLGACQPSEKRCLTVLSQGDEEDEVDGENEEEQQGTKSNSRSSGSHSNFKKHDAGVQTVGEFATTTRRHELSSKGKNGAVSVINDASRLASATNDFKNSTGPRMQVPTITDYHYALQLMRERVECIRALIREGVGTNEHHSEGEGVSSGGDCCMMGENDVNNKANSDDDDCCHEGRPRMHSFADPHLTSPKNMVRQQQQEQQGLSSSPRPPSAHSHHIEECRRVSLYRTSTPHERRHATSEAVAHASPVTPDGRGNKDEDDDDDEDEDERFTVNVCMSGDCECPAFVVPAEPSVFDQKPPVPPPRSGAHDVDRLCFDSSLSEPTLRVSSLQSSVRRPTPRAEGDDLTNPFSSLPVDPDASAAVISFSDRGQRTRAVAYRGRLGGHVAEVMAPMPEFELHTRTESSTPHQSMRLSYGDDEESSISTQDYRRPPMSGSTGVTASARNNTRFMRLGSVRGVNEENDDDIGDEGVLPRSSVAVQPSRSPSNHPTQQKQHLILPQSSSLSLLLPETNLFNGDAYQPFLARKDVLTEESRDTSGPPVGSAPLSAASPTESTEGLGGTRQPFLGTGGSFVFDPVLQCCLDLRTNTYVVGAGRAQKETV